jgi:hypothetical protein
MKPASIINRGENFVTLRATTDRPAEIREALSTRDVQHVMKGDQNQAWDAVLANHCLARAIGDSGAEITFFIQDERLGTADARLAREWRHTGQKYALTEDYYRGRAGAVWEHQDATYGLFFTEAVAPEQFAAAGVHLHRAAALWDRHAEAIRADQEWVVALASLGVALPETDASADSASHLGPAVHREALAQAACDYPSVGLYYALTKTDGLYGIVPVVNDNATLSSIPAGHPEMQAAGEWLLVRAAARGAMRLAANPTHRRGVRDRARQLLTWSKEFLAEQPDASVADYQDALGQWLTAEVFPADRLTLDRSSHFMRVDESTRDADPTDTMQLFLDLALRFPADFAEAYNDALNTVGYGLQRMKYEPTTGRYTPPFFVELSPAEGEPVYRYGIELSGVATTTIRLANDTAGDILWDAGQPVRCARDIIDALLKRPEAAQGASIIGKAATFAAEMQRSPRGMGLPRQGSKYAPMVDHLVGGLRARGVLNQPTGLLIRIGLNAMDRLDAMGEMPLRLPSFLHAPLGREATCRDVAQNWRRVAREAREELEMLGRCQVGQHVHLAKLLMLNSIGGDWRAAAQSDPRLRKLIHGLVGSNGAGSATGTETEAILSRLGRELSREVGCTLERLVARREELLAERAALAKRAAEATRSGRVVPDVECRQRLDTERERVEAALLVLIAAYVRRLWQRAESLPYLNDRPYTLALYLLFGRDIFPPICRNVEFDIEYLSPIVDPTPSCPHPEACGAGA